MEGHGNFKGKKMYIIYHLVANQEADSWLQIICVLVCFACLVSSNVPTDWYSGEKCYYLSCTLIAYNSQQVWLLAHHHLPLRPSQGEI
jgi:hypothetical protein